MQIFSKKMLTSLKMDPEKAHLDLGLGLKISQRYVIVVSFIIIEIVVLKVKISKVSLPHP